jgi:hypothetical protein
LLVVAVLLIAVLAVVPVVLGHQSLAKTLAVEHRRNPQLFLP